MAHILVDEGKHHGVGGGDHVERAARGQGEQNTGGQHKEEKGGREQIHPHGGLFNRGKLLHEAGAVGAGSPGACLHGLALVDKGLLREDPARTPESPGDTFIRARHTSDAGAIDLASGARGHGLGPALGEEENRNCQNTDENSHPKGDLGREGKGYTSDLHLS